MTDNIEEINIENLNRSQILKILFDSVKIIGGKVTSERVRSVDGDETRLKYARALAQLATPLLAALRDTQLDEILSRLKALELEKEERRE